MTNRDLQAAWTYHNGTKHSYWSIRNNPHFLDWSNRPLPFKIYPGLEPHVLPKDLSQSGVAALSAISQMSLPRDRESMPTLQDLARILYFSAGVTRSRSFPGGEIYFRAAACTGALYEVELYVVCADLPGLEAGVYHFNPADVALRRLRPGDFRGNLAHATAGQTAVAHAPAVIVCTGTYWRNAWKYQARTYRHFGWDNGTLLANALAAGTASGAPVEVVMGFVDAEVNRLLDLDTRREVAFSLLPIGHQSHPKLPPPRDVPVLGLETVPLSAREVEYPGMLEMHEASSLKTEDELRRWPGPAPPAPASPPSPDEVPLRPLSEEARPQDTVEQVILRRGSSRSFDRTASLTFEQLSTILDSAARGVPADFLHPPGAQWNDLYLLVHAVEGLKPGAYFFHRDRRTLELLKAGDFRAEAFHLGLEQELPADACADVFFLADLNRILERYGNRGYRAVQLESGIIGGRMYLASYAQRLGATGLTFFDDDVVNFFSPHAAGKSAIFLVALGKRLEGKRTRQ
jgi:SagB-type dehydrogenase family enzyme